MPEMAKDTQTKESKLFKLGEKMIPISLCIQAIVAVSAIVAGKELLKEK